MNLTLQRIEYVGDKRTLGTLSPDGRPRVCYTMEPRHDLARANVPRSDTAVPAGRYPFFVRKHDKRELPIIDIGTVGRRTGIQIHTGSFDDDTLGCPMPGLKIIDSPDGRTVSSSRAAMVKLLLTVTGEKSIDAILAGLKAGKRYPGTITIKDKVVT